MKNKIRITVILSLWMNIVLAQEQKIVFITIDGLRWQEVFRGLDNDLAKNKDYTPHLDELLKNYDGNNPIEKRKKLMPFFWSTIAQNGIIIGNRDEESYVNLANGMHFSYPGYNEIITGYADDKNITSNDKILNPNVSIFEYINNQSAYKNSVHIFGSWDVFPFIFNYKRSQLPINAGYMHSYNKNPSSTELLINKLQDETPKRWHEVRFDVFTHNYALETMKNLKPKVLYIGYGETDDFAHDGKYNNYIESTNNTDKMIRELWEYTQSDPFYKDQTTFIITTDHGRGIGKFWTNHSNKTKGADETWMAFIGNKVKTKNNFKGQYYNNQLAATIAKFLNIEYQTKHKIGKPIF